METKALNPQENARRNRSVIFTAIRNNGPVGKSELSKITGLTFAAVAKFGKELIDEGLVREAGFASSRGGRRSMLLELNPEAGFVVGVDLGATRIRAVLTDLSGRIKKSAMKETGLNEGRGKVIKKLKDLIRTISRGIEKKKIKGIGIGISGVVDSSGICLFWPGRTDWDNLNLKEISEKEFNLPVIVDDNSRTAALAIKRYEAREVKNLLCITIGMGVGSGIFIDGKLYRGSKGIAGELGHTTVDENGPQCNCGNFGCLESLISGPAILRRAKKALENGVHSSLRRHFDALSVELICKAADKGDKLSSNVLEETGKYLGIGIANAINLFNPQMVILSGGISRIGDLLLNSVKRTVQSRALEVSAKNVEIKLSAMDDYCGALGSAVLILDEFFENQRKEKCR